MAIATTYCAGKSTTGLTPIHPENQSLPPIQKWVEFTSFCYTGVDRLHDEININDDEYYNPIISGFYPDPSICRVGENFYLVNSSFAYYPGVPIFHSTDLVNWTQLGHVLDRESQLDLDGLPTSSGIFAPAITYHDDLYYLITTNVRGIGNFYVTAKDPAGPWSDPIKLSIDGIDPSFFFDDDGSVYIVHNGPPPEDKPLYNGHRAIWMWEYDMKTKELRNGRIIVNGGVNLEEKPVWIEGPHIFKRNGCYYLTCAEGGTSVNHTQVIFRTKSLDEQFTPYRNNPILSQRGLDSSRANPVTSVGHADLVDTGNGEWWAVFLGVRPYKDNHYNTGRETFLLPVRWENDWPMILDPGTSLPRKNKKPILKTQTKISPQTTGSFTWRDDFNKKDLAMEWLFLRGPKQNEWWSLSDVEGSLLIAPREESLNSSATTNDLENKTPSYISRRQQHKVFTATCSINQNPGTIPCEYGLATLQNNDNYFFLGIRKTEHSDHEIFLETRTKESISAEPLTSITTPLDSSMIELRISADCDKYTFSYRTDFSKEWTILKKDVDGSILSTQSAGGFVGATIGMYTRLLNQ